MSLEGPLEDSSERYADANDGENEVRIPVMILHAVGWDEGRNGQADLGNEVERSDGK